MTEEPDTDDEPLITFGSGNVFADLGLADPERHLALSRLRARLRDHPAAIDKLTADEIGLLQFYRELRE